MSAWIYDRFPPRDMPVLVWHTDGGIFIGVRLLESDGWEASYQPFDYWDDRDNDGMEWADADILCWQPLPEPPL